MVVPVHVKSHGSLGFRHGVREGAGRAGGRAGVSTLALTDLESLVGSRSSTPPAGDTASAPSAGWSCDRVSRDAVWGSARGGWCCWRETVPDTDAGAASSGCAGAARVPGRAAWGPANPVAALARSPEGLMALSDDPAVLRRITTCIGRSSPYTGARRWRMPLPRVRRVLPRRGGGGRRRARGRGRRRFGRERVGAAAELAGPREIRVGMGQVNHLSRNRWRSCWMAAARAVLTPAWTTCQRRVRPGRARSALWCGWGPATRCRRCGRRVIRRFTRRCCRGWRASSIQRACGVW